ncbi:MAG: DUF5320 domain-containing protein [Spirochaetales bacterium]|nr:DUF5320 domain-containing protein [Spirochaetales bacterium]
MNRNGMGPENMGPMTGRGMGSCKKNGADVNAQGSFGTGRRGAYGRGRGAGRGCGRGFGGPGGFGRGMSFGGQSVEGEDVSALLGKIKELESQIKELKEGQS